MSDRTGIAIRVPHVPRSEAGPRDAESRAVGNDPAFQELVRQSRARRATGERGTSIDDALAEAEAEERASAVRRQPATASTNGVSRQTDEKPRNGSVRVSRRKAGKLS